jgi:3'(2'), 5'-bisphosphate nucleotidase
VDAIVVRMHFRGHPPLPREALLSVLDLCRSAAAAIVSHYDPEDDSAPFWRKDDRSPLTAADLASHHILADGLARVTPELPLLSEESEPQAIAGRRQWDRFWMVDPLDGTREFLERSGEFTINVALVEQQRPVVGIIYLPLEERAFVGVVGEGAWTLQAGDSGWQWTPLQTRPLPEDELVVLASRRHRNARLEHCLAFLGEHRRLERRNSGSALKFCDLAAAKGDCYPRFSPCSEWDVAAGDALITAAGGALWGLNGAPLRYNDRDTLLSPQFLAVAEPGNALWPGLLQALD